MSVNGEAVLKIYNFYSCCYLLNYIDVFSMRQDKINQSMVYLKLSTGFSARFVNIILSADQAISNEFSGWNTVELTCGTLFLKKKKALQLLLNGNEPTSEDAELLSAINQNV